LGAWAVQGRVPIVDGYLLDFRTRGLNFLLNTYMHMVIKYLNEKQQTLSL